MEGFQFIIESPQDTQSHKKRPRLVTSCDNCRSKKVKCLQTSPESQCEACKVAKIQCKFRDRERYFAERSRAIAGPSTARPTTDVYPNQGGVSRSSGVGPNFPSGPGGSPTSPVSTHRSPSYSPPSGGHSSEGHVRNPSYPLDHTRSPGSQSVYRLPQSSSNHSHGRQPSQSAQHRSPHLFDATHPQCPQRAWMQQFIQLFISNMGAQCPFLTYDEIYDKFRRQSLSPLLSNCIAALGARFSDIPEVVARGPQSVADTYCDLAKEQMSTSLQHPTIETVQAVILLAWAEYKSNRGHGFRQYSELAMRTAMAIGLSEESSLQLSPYDPYQNRLRVIWSSLGQLQLYASSDGVETRLIIIWGSHVFMKRTASDCRDHDSAHRPVPDHPLEAHGKGIELSNALDGKLE